MITTTDNDTAETGDAIRAAIKSIEKEVVEDIEEEIEEEIVEAVEKAKKEKVKEKAAEKEKEAVSHEPLGVVPLQQLPSKDTPGFKEEDKGFVEKVKTLNPDSLPDDAPP